jgi:hypothetical protein
MAQMYIGNLRMIALRNHYYEQALALNHKHCSYVQLARHYYRFASVAQ